MDNYHKSVLLQEALFYLKIAKNKKYIDATIGGGGHAQAILKLGGSVLGIDQDDEALEYVEKRIRNDELGIKERDSLTLVKGNFGEIKEIANRNGFTDVKGILFDLGVSSHQLESDVRGFSFQKDMELDMRMDKSLKVKAKDLINGLSMKELEELFKKFGEEPFAKVIAKNIHKARTVNPIERTQELVDIVRRSMRPVHLKFHPATRVFQALRIAVNDELNNLRLGLNGAIDILGSQGRIVVISFHSLEDRIVKNFFEESQEKGIGVILSKKPILPTGEEIDLNRRSRSAKLRVFEKN